MADLTFDEFARGVAASTDEVFREQAPNVSLAKLRRIFDHLVATGVDVHAVLEGTMRAERHGSGPGATALPELIERAEHQAMTSDISNREASWWHEWTEQALAAHDAVFDTMRELVGEWKSSASRPGAACVLTDSLRVQKRQLANELLKTIIRAEQREKGGPDG